MKLSGIYKIQSKCKPERCYIGSAVNIHARWIRHRWELLTGVHPSGKLQRHYDKYGISDLQYSVLICCEKDSLITTEQFYLDSHKAYFNVCKNAGSVLGIKRSEETKLKIGKANKGRQTALGRKVSEETRAKISKTLMGHKNSINLIGIPRSAEVKKKIGDKQRGILNHNYGKHPSPELLERMRQCQKGKKVSDETKQNMRNAWILRKAKKTVTN